MHFIFFYRYEASQIEESVVASDNPILNNEMKNENLDCTLADGIKRENIIENKRRKKYHENLMQKFNKNNLIMMKKNAELNKAIKENIRVRLNNRFEFLKHRINLSEECRVGCMCAVGDYITANAKDFSVDDIVFRRKKLSEEVQTIHFNMRECLLVFTYPLNILFYFDLLSFISINFFILCQVVLVALILFYLSSPLFTLIGFLLFLFYFTYRIV